MLKTLILAAALCCAGPAWADKFRVDGPRLIYDTEAAGDDGRGITRDDPGRLLDLLRAHPDVTVLELNSAGGRYYSAFDMTRIVLDFELDTHVHGLCESSCTLVFLAGRGRSMSRGSKLGFHQTFWTPDSMAEFYASEQAERNWDSPFDFASWLYKDTQSEIYRELTYMIRRGVDPGFAIETIKDPSANMWYPLRPVLRAAGVLTQ